MMAVETQDPLDELERENDITQKLVERLAETAIALKEGQNLPPGEITEGLRLLEQYRKLHALRVDRDLQPEARPVAMNTCFQHLDAITDDHRMEAARIELVRNAVEEFTRDPEGARTRLAQALADLTEKGHRSVAYENDYPLSCLRAALPDEAGARVTAAFHRTASEVADLEGHIARYLEHTPGTPAHGLTVRCQQANCQASAESHVVPSNDGRFGMELPEGWQAISRPPIFGEDGTIRVNVEFCCPAHRDDGREDEAVPSGLRGCCDPIPGDAR
jgi:hypothetical protein